MFELCIECKKSVSGRRHAVTCDACERWQHRLCNTGISLADYRAAVKKEREIHFLCRDCCNSIPTLNPEDDEEPRYEAESDSIGIPVAESTLALWGDPQVLQVNVPLDLTESADDDIQPPVLERSTPPSVDNVSSLDDSLYQHPPTLERSAPFPNDTVDDDGDYRLQDDTVLSNATYVVRREDEQPMDVTEVSFDISNRIVNDTLPIQEEPVVQEPLLTETIIEDRPLEFKIVEKGSQRGRQLLVDSHGYSYGVKARYTSSVIWRCSVRTSAIKCPVTVKQVGDRFMIGAVRTNNDVEGWHHRLNSKAGMSGLGFYRLVPLLKREATLMEMTLRSGNLQRDNRGTYRRLETRLQEYWTKYKDHEITTTAFLKACASLYGVRISAPEANPE